MFGLRRCLLVCVVAGFLGIASVADAGVTEFGGVGSAPGDFGQGASLAVETDGSVVVSDWINNQLVHYANNGTYLGSVGSTGSGTNPIEFNNPGGVAADPSGDVLIADEGNSRVDILSPGLLYLRAISISGPMQVAANGSFIYVLCSEQWWASALEVQQRLKPHAFR
jgi:hypothetical protein